MLTVIIHQPALSCCRFYGDPHHKSVPEWYGLVSVSVSLRKAVIVILLEEQSDGAESAFSKPSRVSSGLGSFIFFFYEDTHTYSLQWLLLHTHTHTAQKHTPCCSWCSKASCHCFDSQLTDAMSIHLQLPSSFSILLPLSIDLQLCLLQFFLYLLYRLLSFFIWFIFHSFLTHFFHVLYIILSKKFFFYYIRLFPNSSVLFLLCSPQLSPVLSLILLLLFRLHFLLYFLWSQIGFLSSASVNPPTIRLCCIVLRPSCSLVLCLL